MGGCRQVVSVDTSQEALDIARQNVELNKLDLSKAEFVRDDVFKLLRAYRDRGEKFDVIVMDPPKFVENKSQLMGACRGYKDINMLAIQLLNPSRRTADIFLLWTDDHRFISENHRRCRNRCWS